MEKEEQNGISKNKRTKYIRAIPVSATKYMIEPNQKGFKAVKDYVESEGFKEKYAGKLANVEFIEYENRMVKPVTTVLNNSNNLNNSKNSKSGGR
jgi:hypothetical protein